MTSGSAPPYLPGTSHHHRKKKERRSWPPPSHSPIHRFSFRQNIKRYAIFGMHIYCFELSQLPVLKHHHFTGIDDASISHHLVRDLLQFSHMIAAIRVPSAQFIIKIVSIRVQYQGYFDPDIIGPFFHNYIICKTQAQR